MNTASRAPSLLSSARAAQPVARPEAGSLLDLMYDGFYMLFLLRNGYVLTSAEETRARIGKFLAELDRGAKRIHASGEDALLAKYAYCALVDETVLLSRKR